MHLGLPVVPDENSTYHGWSNGNGTNVIGVDSTASSHRAQRRSMPEEMAAPRRSRQADQRSRGACRCRRSPEPRAARSAQSARNDRSRRRSRNPVTCSRRPPRGRRTQHHRIGLRPVRQPRNDPVADLDARVAQQHLDPADHVVEFGTGHIDRLAVFPSEHDREIVDGSRSRFSATFRWRPEGTGDHATAPGFVQPLPGRRSRRVRPRPSPRTRPDAPSTRRAASNSPLPGRPRTPHRAQPHNERGGDGDSHRRSDRHPVSTRAQTSCPPHYGLGVASLPRPLVRRPITIGADAARRSAWPSSPRSPSRCSTSSISSPARSKGVGCGPTC